VGTLEYMAPELLRAAGGGAPADVYALAVTLNEAATGVLPFSDCTRDNPAARPCSISTTAGAPLAPHRAFSRPLTAAPARSAKLETGLRLGLGDARPRTGGRARTR